jgi:hypothetical protein
MIMHMHEAAQLQRAWKQQGDPPCLHPNLTTEEYTSAGGGDYHTGDLVCMTCGAAFFSRQTAEEDREKQRARLSSSCVLCGKLRSVTIGYYLDSGRRVWLCGPCEARVVRDNIERYLARQERP